MLEDTEKVFIRFKVHGTGFDWTNLVVIKSVFIYLLDQS